MVASGQGNTPKRLSLHDERDYYEVMQAVVARETGGALAIDAIEERMGEIAPLFNEWIPNHHGSYQWWQTWRASSYIAYPFAGARLDQPQWLLDDFTMFDLLHEFALLEYERDETERREMQRIGGKAYGR